MAIPSPFVSAPGTEPIRLVGRVRHLAVLEQAMRGVDTVDDPAPRVVAGPAGHGVTALMRYAYERSIDKKWATAFVDVADDATPVRELVSSGLRTAVGQHLRLRPDSRRGARLLEIIEGFAGSRGNVTVDLIETLRTLGPLVDDAGVGLVVFFDNVHRRPGDISAALIASESLVGSGLPVSLILGGLPMEGTERRRLEVEPFGFEKVDELLSASREKGDRVFDARAIDRVTALSRGVPFLVHTFATGAWNATESRIIGAHDVDAARASAQISMLAQWYTPRCQGLSGTDVRYLKAIDPAREGPATSEVVARRVGDTTRLGSGSRLDDVRDALMRRGLIYVDAAGLLRHALPAFGSYLEHRG